MSTSGESNSSKKGTNKWRASVIKVPANPTELSATTNNYDQALADILRGRDVFRFRNFLAANGRGLPDEMMLDTLKMATLMHQLILTLPQLMDLHEFSRQWINDNTALPKNNQSLSEAAKRAPGTPYPEPDLPAPAPGRRTISLRPISPSKN